MSEQFDYVRKYYNVPACYGRIVKVDEKPGIIIEDLVHYIGVNFDADKPGIFRKVHPTWRVEYLVIGVPRKMTKSQQKYHDYIKSGYEGSFAAWLGIRQKDKVI